MFICLGNTENLVREGLYSVFNIKQWFASFYQTCNLCQLVPKVVLIATVCMWCTQPPLQMTIWCHSGRNVHRRGSFCKFQVTEEWRSSSIAPRSYSNKRPNETQSYLVLNDGFLLVSLCHLQSTTGAAHNTLPFIHPPSTQISIHLHFRNVTVSGM